MVKRLLVALSRENNLLHLINNLLPNFVFLTSDQFRIIDSNGNTVGSQVEGLLIGFGGTVCDDGFTDNSAAAICREMGYIGHISWKFGALWTIQSNFAITLDNVICSSNEWSSCTYALTHDCSHGEDVFLQCGQIGRSIFSFRELTFLIFFYLSSSVCMSAWVYQQKILKIIVDYYQD